MKKIIIKYVSFILVIGMLLPLFGDISVCINAKSEREITPYTFRVYTTPFSYNRFNTYKFEYNEDLLNDTIKDLIKYPSYDVYEKWRMLVFYDKLSYGEIHRRVQDDIFRKNTVYLERELEFDLSDREKISTMFPELEGKKEGEKGTTGRADVIYDYNIFGKMMHAIWEVKPYSYKSKKAGRKEGKNRKDGIYQLKKYVTLSRPLGNYVYGKKYKSNFIKDVSENDPITFNVTLFCVDSENAWKEDVTYHIYYEVDDDSLIVYNFERKSEKTNLGEGLKEAYGTKNAKQELEKLYKKYKDLLVDNQSVLTEPIMYSQYVPVLEPVESRELGSIDESGNLIEYTEPETSDTSTTFEENNIVELPGYSEVKSDLQKYTYNILKNYNQKVNEVRIQNDSKEPEYSYRNGAIYLGSAIVLTPVAIKAGRKLADTIIAIHAPLVNKTSHSEEMIIAAESYNNALDEIVINAMKPFIDKKTISAGIATFLAAYSDLFTVTLETEGVSAATIGDTDSLEENLTKAIQNEYDNYGKAAHARPPIDPLVINFEDDDEITITSMEDGVNFDLDNNGFAERTAWIDRVDRFLVFDRNGNGTIDNGSELFGDQVILKNGKKSETGFEALSELNDSGDSQIDKNDSCYESLMVWCDENHNGISENTELESLSKAGVISISLSTEEITKGEKTEERASVKLIKEGNVKNTYVSEFWFDVDSSDTKLDGEVTVGIVPSLNQAILNDETDELYDLCILFSNSEDKVAKHYYLKKILYTITDSNTIEESSRGGNIDARDLHVIESFMGTDFSGVSGANPNSQAASILKNMFRNIEDIYYNILNCHTEIGPYLNMITYKEEDKEVLDFSFINNVLDEKFSDGKSICNEVKNIGIYVKLYDEINNTKYADEFLNHYESLNVEFNSNYGYTYLGTNNNNSIKSTLMDDYLFGEAGNDELYGLSGNDIFYGDYGSDKLYGGAGNDIYKFGSFHGNDIIYDTEGKNSIVFEDTNSIDDYDLSLSLDGGLELINEYTDDSIALPDFLKHPLNYDFISEGRPQVLGGGDSCEVIEGNDEDAYLEAGDGLNIFYGGSGSETIVGGVNMDIMYAGEGDDTLLGRNGVNIMYGEAGNDIIYDGDDSGYLNGGDNNDELYGGGGSDILDGGPGNDYLQGDHGNDTYVFGRGYDIDTVAASSDLHTIVIHNYYPGDMHNTRNADNDLIIDFENETGDRLIVKRFFDYNSNRDYNFIFDNGITLGQYDITAKYAAIYGDDNDNWLAVQGNDGTDIYGGAGNDGLSGGSGNDNLYGESDDDTLYGNDGNDRLDGGSGNDELNGGNGTDTYVFSRGYNNDTINEWSSGNNIILLEGLNSDEVSISDEWGSNLIISVNDTDDTLKINNFKWGQADYTFIFADGAEAVVNKDTWSFEFTKLPEAVEESAEDPEDNVLSEQVIISETETEISEINYISESETSIENYDDIQEHDDNSISDIETDSE